MNYLAVGIAVVASILSAFGSLFFKKCADKFKISFRGIFKNPNLIWGVILYAVTAIAFIYALTMEQLSILYPIMALTYVWVAFLSIKYLREKMNFYKWIGIALIIIGVIFITI